MTFFKDNTIILDAKIDRIIEIASAALGEGENDVEVRLSHNDHGRRVASLMVDGELYCDAISSLKNNKLREAVSELGAELLRRLAEEEVSGEEVSGD